MNRRPTWTDCDEAGDYVVPNVLSPRDLVSRPDIMEETVPHIFQAYNPSTFLIRYFKPLAIFCGCTTRFVSDLVGNPAFVYAKTKVQVIPDQQVIPDLRLISAFVCA